jgi:aminocarboxymuconate-semialdehyde decarboxylase
MCCVSPKRRRLLGTMAALAGGLVPGLPAAATPSVSAGTADKTRSIDIHAHYYPESYCELVGNEGKKFGGQFTCDASTFSFQTPAGGLGPLSLKFIKVDERLADMDASGVDMQALSGSRCRTRAVRFRS